jgi:hypothetical protein
MSLLEAISKGAPLKIKIDASSSDAGKLDSALILNQNPFFEMASIYKKAVLHQDLQVGVLGKLDVFRFDTYPSVSYSLYSKLEKANEFFY